MNYENIIIILLTIYIYFLLIFFFLKKNIYYENYKNIDINIYFINLDKSKDRYESIKKQIKSLDIKNCQRFAGVDGSTYKLTSIENGYFKNCSFNHNINKGTTGCALSHYNLWNLILDKKMKECIVLEDDTIFNNNFNNQLNLLLRKKKNYDLIFLYNTIKHSKKNYKNNKIIPYKKLKWYGCGAHGYYINSRATKYLVDFINKNGFNREVDWVMYEQLHNINIGILKYPIIKLLDVKSVISENNIG